MNKVLLTIQYQISEDKNSEVLKILGRIKDHFAGSNDFTYSVFEQQNKKSFITEEFLFNDSEAYKNFNELEDEIYDEYVNGLNEFVITNTKYTILNQIV